MTQTRPALQEIAEQHSRMVEAAIITGHPAKAHAAVDRAFQTIHETARDRLTVDSRLSNLLTIRMASILEAGGIRTIGQLCQRTRESLATVDQIQWRSIDLIERQLRLHGFALTKTDVTGSDSATDPQSGPDVVG